MPSAPHRHLIDDSTVHPAKQSPCSQEVRLRIRETLVADSMQPIGRVRHLAVGGLADDGGDIRQAGKIEVTALHRGLEGALEKSTP
jgi:hypothetical protein